MNIQNILFKDILTHEKPSSPKYFLHISGATGITLSTSKLTTRDSSGVRYNKIKEPSAFPATLP